MTSERLSRRRFGRTLAVVGSLFLAGCLGDDEEENGHSHDNDSADETDPDETDEADLEDLHPDLRINDRGLSSAYPVELVEPDAEDIDGHARLHPDALVAEFHWHDGLEHSHWHQSPLEVPHGEYRTVRVRFVDHNREELSVGPDQEYQVRTELTEDAFDVLEAEAENDLIELYGQNPGDGQLRIELLREEETVFEPEPVPLAVVEAGADE